MRTLGLAFVWLALASCGGNPSATPVAALTPSGLPASSVAPPTASPTSAPSTAFDPASAMGFAAEQMAFGPRVPGTPAHEQAEAAIVGHLRQFGWDVEEQHLSYRGVALVNVVARKGAADARPVILGAHYDTRPRADRDPTHPDQPVPGANDGASGVSVLLELARVIPPPGADQALWLAFFDGEDSGGINDWEWIVGSTYFAGHLSTQPKAVVVVDMVGDVDLQIYEERNSDPALTQSIWSVAARLGEPAFIPQPKYPLLDDQMPFLEKGIPAADIIDFDYPPWHTTGDTLDKISAASLGQVGRTLQAWIAQSQ